MFQNEVKIPKSRIAVLIGTEGKTKKSLEKSTKSSINIDSESGIVTIQGEDSLHLLKVEKIIQAIGRGFNPEIALSLLDDENQLEIIPLNEFSGKSKKKETRIKSRIIGSKGKVRTTLEYISHTHISIFGKTVSILGRTDHIAIARLAVSDILAGAPHGPVYATIERKMKELKKSK